MTRTIDVNAFAGLNAITAYVDCPAGKRIVGGGAVTSNFKATASGYPQFFDGSATPYRLTVQAHEVVADANAWQIRASAVCAKVT